jgi:bacterioferritin-associated ferredoxin
LPITPEGTAVYACICLAVPMADVLACIDDGAHDEETVGKITGAGTGCGGCLDRICELLRTAGPSRLLQRAG